MDKSIKFLELVASQSYPVSPVFSSQGHISKPMKKPNCVANSTQPDPHHRHTVSDRQTWHFGLPYELIRPYRRISAIYWAIYRPE